MDAKKFAAIVAGATLAAVTAGCGGGNNANTANGAGSRNSNMAVVTNSNAATNTSANTATSTNANANGVNYTANISREDYERNKEAYAEDARKSGRTIGNGANDRWLWVKVRSALATAPDLRDSTINVDVENGVVTLSGDVADGNQKVRAVDVANKVEDVKKVQNKLQVRAGGGGGGTNANAGGGAKKG